MNRSTKTQHNFNGKKAELLEILIPTKKDSLRLTYSDNKPKTNLGQLTEVSVKDNHKLLSSGNYVKQSLSNMRRTFKLN